MAIKAKDKTTGKIIDVAPAFGGYFSCNGELIPQGDLEFNYEPAQSEATISGWVTVDDFDNAYIYHSKPTQRCREFCDTGDYISDWDCDTKYPNGKRCYVIDKDLFPKLTPDSDPIEIEIIIKPKKQ